MENSAASKGKTCFILQILCCMCVVSVTWWLTMYGPMQSHRSPIYKLATKIVKNLPPFNSKHKLKELSNAVQTYTGSYAAIFNIPKIHVRGVNCNDLFHGKGNTKFYQNMDSLEWHLPDAHYINATSNCPSFIQSMKYITKPISAEEAAFPLAFSLIVYKDVHQVEQLLRAIYRPQNHYCIHVDANAKPSVYRALSKIASCFPNVVMASQRFRVHWGSFEVLQSEFTCMQDLWNKTDWKYFINLTGQEFPLKTILDIIRILKVYNGANAIGWEIKNRYKFKQRVQYHYIHPGLPARRRPKEPPPHNIKIEFGPVHVALTRSFVGFILKNKVAQDFKQWLRDTNIPDETFFSSLHVNPRLGVPGAFTGDPNTPNHLHEIFIRYKKWGHCKARSLRVRSICILGVNDLPDLYKAPEMFVNKFFSEHQPVARMCLEQLIFNRTRAQAEGGPHLNLTTRCYKEHLVVPLQYCGSTTGIHFGNLDIIRCTM